MATNATTVTLTITLPDGTSTSPAVVNPPATTGQYQVDFLPTVPGRHVVRWTSTTPTAAYTDVFDVRPAAAPMLLSLADAKLALNMPLTSTADDDELRALNEAVTTLVEQHRNEVIVRRAVTQTVTIHGRRRTRETMDVPDHPAWTRRIVLRFLPVVSLTSVTRTDVPATWLLTDLVVDKTTGVLATIGPLFVGTLDVVYTAGYDVIPANYTAAARIILQHMWAAQQQAGLGMNSGPFATDGGGPPHGFSIPNRAAELLGGRPPMIA